MTSREALDVTGLQILDGGLATELERAGCDLSSPLWSGDVLRSQPAQIVTVHRSYLEAGADCLLTASYQISAHGFREIGMGELEAEAAAAEALFQSVALAERARRDYAAAGSRRRIWIAGSLGAYGAALHNGAEFHGNYDIRSADLTDFHAKRIAVMRETAADFLGFETVPSLGEAQAILAALAQFPNVAAYISFTCRDDAHTGHGEPIEDCARLLKGHSQILAIGINCTAPRYVGGLVGRIRMVGSQRIAVYPNSGELWVSATRSWSGNSDPEAFGLLARSWRAAGADWIGGCCRTRPEHIQSIAAEAVPGRWSAGGLTAREGF